MFVDNWIAKLFRSMEPLSYAAIKAMIQTGQIDNILKKKEKMFWQNHIKEYSIREDGGLLWRGLKIPAIEQLNNV